jgi:NitT/TauT family transport system substrate-binding protein
MDDARRGPLARTRPFARTRGRSGLRSLGLALALVVGTTACGGAAPAPAPKADAPAATKAPAASPAAPASPVASPAASPAAGASPVASPSLGASPSPAASPVAAASPTAAPAAALPPPTGPAKDVSFRLNALAVGVQSPFYLALERGYYRDQGLNVTIREGTGSGATAQLIGTNQDTIGLSDSTAVITARSRGVPIKIVGNFLQLNGFGVISLKDKNIVTPKDLEGKRVGTTTGDGPYQLFAAIVKSNNLDESKIQLVNMDQAAKVPSLLQGQVDAILGGADDQAITVRAQGRETNVMFYSDVGAATIGLAIVANEEVIRNDPDFVRRFLAASIRGMDDGRKDLDAAIAALTKNVATARADTGKAQLEVINTRLFSASSNTLGRATDADWQATFELLTTYVGVPADKPITDYYDYSFLPASLPGR